MAFPMRAHNCLNTYIRLLAQALTMLCWISNLFLCCFACLLGALFAADLVISSLYQFAMPPSAALAIADALLIAVFFPWFVILIATLANVYRWPLRYTSLQKIFVKCILKCCCCVSCCRNIIVEEDQDYYHIFAVDIRVVLRHSASIVIWMVTFGIAFNDSVASSWLFLSCSVLFVLANNFFDLEKLKAWKTTRLAPLILFRRGARFISMFGSCVGLLTLSMVVGKSGIGVMDGGVAAIVLSYLMGFLLVFCNAFVLWKKPFQYFAWETFQLKSKETIILAAIDVGCLSLAMILMFAAAGATEGVTVFILMLPIILLYVSLYFSHHDVVELRQQTEAENKLDRSSSSESSINASTSLRTEGMQSLQAYFAGSGSNVTADGKGQRITNADTNDDDHEENKKVKRFFIHAPRFANAIVILTSLLVFTMSCINTGSNPVAISCPGKFGNGTKMKYAVCGLRFGHDNILTGGSSSSDSSSLKLVDFASLTAMTYMSVSNRQDAITTFFPNENVILNPISVAKTADKFIGVDFSIFRFPNRKISVIAIRGSFRSIDWLQNLYIMSDSIAIQLSTVILPFKLSDSVTATLVSIAASFKFGMNTYSERVRAAVAQLKSTYPGDTEDIFLVGHSLGGFTANIVAAQTNTRSITFSPIGTGHLYKRFHFSVATANRVIVSIVPKGDLVPRIDQQLGDVQHITESQPCTLKNSMCHSMLTMIYSLSLVCGDPLGRYLLPTGTTIRNC